MLKLKIFYIIVTLLFLLILAGCTENDEFLNSELIVEGRPSTISLQLNVETSKIETRATTGEDLILNNIYIFIFNEEGEIDSRHYILNPEYSDQLDHLSTFSGNNKQIYAIANIGLGIMSITKEELDNVKSLDDLENTYPHLLQQVLQRGSEFLMSGHFSDKDGDIIYIDIKEGLNTAPSEGSIRLNKLDAKVTFNITSEPDITFRARSWQALRISSNTALINQKESMKSPIVKTYFDSDIEILASVAGTTGFTFYTLENSLKGIKEIPMSGLATPDDNYYDKNGEIIEKATEDIMQNAGYALRSKRVKTPEYDENTVATVANGGFEYANDSSSYVKIIGVVSYADPNPENEGNTIQATVEYTIHLGYANKDPNDYETNINTAYTYNVHIVSVNNIIVEATSDKDDNIERQPGVEGQAESVRISINVDSHYEVSKFTLSEDIFKEQAIPNDNLEEGKKFFWYNSTPFQTHMLSNTDTPIEDYEWVYFRLNTKNTDGNYKNSYEPYKKEFYREDDPYANLGFGLEDYLSESERLITVAQLNELFNIEYEKYQNNENYSSDLLDKEGNVTFTIFINEFFYKNDPILYDENDPVDKLLWKKFVNKNPRVMGLLTNTNISADNNSIYTETALSISQAAIQTIYNVDADGLNTAWGSENYPTLYRDLGSENPMRRIPFADRKEIEDSHESNDLQHGLANTLHLVGGVGVRWNDVMDPAVNQLEDKYKLVRYACMQRNRDLNGNGILDKNELRWYLASINQLTDLWIGETSLKGLRLYNGNGDLPIGSEKPNDISNSEQWGEELYASSTILGENVYHLWSAECSSISVDSYVSSRTNEISRDRSYRCLRDLGFDDENRTDFNDIPQDFASYDVGTRVINLKYLNPSSLREYSTIIELPSHNGQSLDNLPRLSFEFAESTKALPGNARSLDWSAMQEGISIGTSFCPEGYRVPNQRELALMASRIVDEDGKPDVSQWFTSENGEGLMLSRTSFSFNPSTGDIKRPAFAAIVNNEILNIILIQHGVEDNPLSHVYCTGTVRCVKDLE